MKTIFGPILSRRFGKSLGIDLSPGKKQCNFDCLYCELAPAKPLSRIENPIPVEVIVQELREALQRHRDLDVVTLTANGEPTLYPHLDRLVEEIKKLRGPWQSLILSNASTVMDPSVRKTLAKIDIVKLSLDCATPRCFKRLDRPAEGVELEAIVEGIRTFREMYDKTLILEILLVDGLNTSEREIAAFNEILPSLKADRIDIGTVDRPPAYPVKPLDEHRLHKIAARLDPALPISLPIRQEDETQTESYTADEILKTLETRPLTKAEIEKLFDEPSRLRLRKLIYDGKVVAENVENETFYSTPSRRRKGAREKKNQ